MIYKIGTSLAVLGSTAAMDFTSLKTENDVIKYFRERNNIQHFVSTHMASSLQSSDVSSSAAVSGSWVTMSGYGSCASTTSTPPAIEGYKMGVCALVKSSTSGSPNDYYSSWACTQDATSQSVVMTETRYSDSSCTASASVQSPVTLSMTCSNGEIIGCPTGSPYDDANVVNTYSDGILSTQYGVISDCNSKLNQIGFFGGAGCVGGAFFGEDSLSVYLSIDCTGPVFMTMPYSTIFPAAVGTCVYDSGGDDGDDDDTLDFIYNDDSYWTVDYGDEDDDDVCFHVDTKINYKGIEYTYEDLLSGKEAECTVPHSPFSRGVVITTSCGKTVRVTDTHLMATTKGFQLAYSLKSGDVLFGDYNSSNTCVVESVEKEKSTQQYFGLNCVHSEVLASGLRASTFGDFHTLPSWYMSYVGSLMGLETASKLGEYVAEWFVQV